MSDSRTRLVADGYDEIGERFVEWRDRIVGDPRREWEAELTSRLPDGARVLELGCGSGIPDTQRLATRFQVTGVDISPRQVERARLAVPDAEFVEADFTAMQLSAGSFEAVAAFYSFNHVPRELLARLLGSIHRWLVPGGYLLTAFGTGDEEAWVGDWLGAPTFFSSFPPETNSRLMLDAGFDLLREEIVTFHEPDGPATFHWIIAST